MFPWDVHMSSPSPEPPRKDPLPFSQKDPLQPRYIYIFLIRLMGLDGNMSRTSQESELCSRNKPQWFKTTKLISHSYYTSKAGQQKGSVLWGDSGPRADQRHSFGIAFMRTKAVRICSEVTHITSALLSLAKPCNTGVWKERQHIRDQPDNNHKVQSPSDACVSPVTAQKGPTFTWTSLLTGSSPSNKQLI